MEHSNHGQQIGLCSDLEAEEKRTIPSPADTPHVKNKCVIFYQCYPSIMSMKYHARPVRRNKRKHQRSNWLVTHFCCKHKFVGLYMFLSAKQ